MNVLLFGGDGVPGRKQPPLDLLSPNAYGNDFHRWLGQVYGFEEDAPADSASLHRFRPWSLVDRFRSDYESGRLEAQMGMSAEATALMVQLQLHQPVTVLLSRAYASQPLARIRRKRLMDAVDLVKQCSINLAIMSPVRVSACIWLRTFGHTITLTGGDRNGQWIEYADNRRSTTLLQGLNAMRGSTPGTWRAKSSALAPYLVCVLLTEMFAAYWQADPSPEAPTVSPVDLWRGWRPDRWESEQNATSVLLDREPASRNRHADAATALAMLARQYSNRAEERRWLRRAATMGSARAAASLVDILDDDGSGDEREYWLHCLGGQDPLFVEDRGRDSAVMDSHGWSVDEAVPTQWAPAYVAALGMAARGDIHGGREILEEVLREDRSQMAPEAAYEFARFAQRAEPSLAKEYYRLATLSTHLPVVNDAARRYGACSLTLGDSAGSSQGMGRATWCGVPLVRPNASAILRLLLPA